MDVDELLDAIVASIFLIIVSLIGIYFPYICARIFGTHNPYLILEVAGFITYSTSEPGNMVAAFSVTNAPVFLYEFRIIPPIHPSALEVAKHILAEGLYYILNPLYSNNDFLVSIGICYVENLWQQLADDAFISFMTEITSYFGPADLASLAKLTVINTVGMYGLYTFQSALLQYESGNHNFLGDILNGLQSSLGPALWSSLEFTIMQVTDMVLDEVLPPPFDFIAGFAFNLLFTASITLSQYYESTTDPYKRCHYNHFIQKTIANLGLFSITNGEYTIYQPYLTLSIYYNPMFAFYNGCYDYYLCNNYTYIYDPGNTGNDNIFKLELGNVNSSGQLVFPEFIILSKVGAESGGQPYLNVSILSSTS